MKKTSLFFFFLLCSFLLSGLFLCFSSYYFSKKIWIANNEVIIQNLIEKHPELELEIISSLETIEVPTTSVLKKYGLTNLENLDYLNSIAQYQKKYFFLFFLYLLFFLFLFLFFFLYQRREQKKQIQKIDRYLFSLLSKEIQVDLKDFQSGELATLQNDLLKVTTRLKNSLETVKQSKQELARNLADISHQLKTPLTSLYLMEEALKSEDMTLEMRHEFLKKQEQVLDHMKHLITSLLKVSQVESGTITLKKDSLCLKEILENILIELEEMQRQKNVKVKINCSLKIQVIGDAVWLKEAILNLIKNSLEHSYPDGIIEITGKDTPLYTELKIEDHGKGILKEDIPHIFKRFYKGKQKTNGIGIGLNLTKNILDRMNATINVKSKPNEKTIFTIHFYKTTI